MAHTNSTANLKLSQFIGTDKPTFLGDYNSDMSKIDSAVAAVQETTGDYDNRLEKVETNQTEADKTIAAVSKTVQGVEESVETINASLDGKAPTLHTSTDGRYGVASASLYGHVLLTDTVNSNQSAVNGVAPSGKAVAAALQPYASVVSLLAQAMSTSPYDFGDSGIQQAKPGGALSGGSFNDMHWQWINGSLHVTGRESISGSFGTSFIVWDAGLFKVAVPSGTVGDYILSYGSIGNDAGRYLARCVYNTTTGVLRIDSPFLASSSTPVWVDMHVPCGCDLTQLA